MNLTCKPFTAQKCLVVSLITVGTLKLLVNTPLQESSDDISEELLSMANSPISVSNTLPRLTEALRPFTDWIYSQSYPWKGASLNDLYKLESQLPSTSSEFCLIDVSITLKVAPRLSLRWGIVQWQVFLRIRYDILVVNENSDESQKLDSVKIFTMSYFSAQNVDHLLSDLKELFESHLKWLKHSKTVHNYLNAMSHFSDLHKNLRLLKMSLQPGS